VIAKSHSAKREFVDGGSAGIDAEGDFAKRFERGELSSRPADVRTTGATMPQMTGLLQLRVLRFRFFQDGDVGVGVFPEGKEVLVCRLGFGGITCDRVGATELKV
jgi:hypothetical protein